MFSFFYCVCVCVRERERERRRRRRRRVLQDATLLSPTLLSTIAFYKKMNGESHVGHFSKILDYYVLQID